VRIVLDTSVLVAAMRSPTGASRELVRGVIQNRLRPLISVPLALEYEAVLSRAEHLQASGWTVEEAIGLVKTFCQHGEPVHLSHRLHLRLPDPKDEFVLETAFHGKADAIVTFNRNDFLIPARTLNIETIPPGEALERLRRS
jgi:putative PIN family toxin of toxin-antitoxin system